MAVIRFGSFEVDLRAGELRKHGTLIGLQQQPFRILAQLLERPGEVVTREELRQAIWPTTAFGSFDQGLDAAVYKLRGALGDSAEHPHFIETLPRRGYRFIAALDHPVEPSHPEPAGQGATAPKRQSLRWVGGLALAVAVVLVMAGGGLPMRSLGRTAPPRIRSLAVLPLANLSGDSAQEYFADGMTEAITTRLGNTPGLRVISHMSAMHYKGTRQTLPEIGRELDVDAVVTGGVLRAGSRVRITAQLAEASSDRNLWAETYEQDLRDVLALQDALAQAVANEVQIRVSPASPSPAASTRARPVDPQAYDLYLRGRAEWNERTATGFRTSIEYFEHAIQRDSGYAPAWAGLSDAYLGLGAYNFVPPTVAWPKAKAAALRAIQLDETLSEAHVPLAIALQHLEWSWSDADREFRRAIALNPNNGFAHEVYGHLLSARGQFEAAIGEMQRAVDLDPLVPERRYGLAATFYRAGRYDEALQHFRLVRDDHPDAEVHHLRIAAILEREGRLPEATAERLLALKLGGKEEVAAAVEREYRSRGYAAAKRAYLIGHLREAQRQAQGVYPRPHSVDIAADYALLGERDRAFEWLERAFRERDWDVVFLAVDPRFDSLRSDRRFRDLTRRIGLPDI